MSDVAVPADIRIVRHEIEEVGGRDWCLWLGKVAGAFALVAYGLLELKVFCAPASFSTRPLTLLLLHTVCAAFHCLAPSTTSLPSAYIHKATMSLETTPSKKVRDDVLATLSSHLEVSNPINSQAASALETLKMESPIKKVQFQPEADKENIERQYASDEKAVPVKGIPDLADLPDPDEPVKPVVAEGIKEEEVDEPLLQENPQRFVLFPIKYHEVCNRDAT